MTIFTNTKNTEVNTCVVINDISDHFITLIQPQLTTQSHSNKPILRQDVSGHKMENFRKDLEQLLWRTVMFWQAMGCTEAMAYSGMVLRHSTV